MTLFSFAYIGALLFSSLGMFLLDWRYKLAFFEAPKITCITLITGLVLFTFWDSIGITLGIFFTNGSPFMTGWYLAPDYPVEELMFLLFLSYIALIIYRIGVRRWPLT